MTASYSPDTLFHLDDPDTSRDAAINLSGHATEQLCHAIVALITERGSLAPFELERIYGDVRARRAWPLVGFYGVHKRCSQMKKQMGVLRGTGERVKPPTGKAAERLTLTLTPTEAHQRVTAFFAHTSKRTETDV